MRYAPLFWLIPSILLISSVALDWGIWLAIFLGCAVFGGAVAHFRTWAQLQYYELRVKEIDAERLTGRGDG